MCTMLLLNESTYTHLWDTNLFLYGSWNTPPSGWRGQGPGWWAQLLGSAQNREFHDAHDMTSSSTNIRSSQSAEKESQTFQQQMSMSLCIWWFITYAIVNQIEPHLPYCQHLYSESGIARCTWVNRPILCTPSASSWPRCVLNSHFFGGVERWEEGKTKHGLAQKSWW